jgi:glycosyltransferase involved in cell wall biosynthesis
MNIVYSGPIFNCSGYSQLRHLFLRLSQRNNLVKINHYGTVDETKILYEEEFRRLGNVEVLQPYVNIVAGIGPQLVVDPNAFYNIAYSMFETTEIPENWIKFYNQFDEIWVPSTFCEKAFNRRDIKCLINVIPFGIDDLFINSERKEHDLFTFFASGQWVDRKGWDILIKAYTAEFMGNYKVRLCIKTFNDLKTNEEMIKDYLDNNVRSSNYMPRIMIKNQKVDEIDLPLFYQEADCFVLPSRGEAMGIPYLESMSMGIPVIAPDFGGQLDFVNEEVGWLIPINQLRHLSERLCSINSAYKNLWFCESTVEDLRKILRYVFEHKQEAIEKGIKAKKIVEEFFNWDKVTNKAEKRLNEIFEVL